MPPEPRDRYGGPLPQTLSLDPVIRVRRNRSTGLYVVATLLCVVALGMGAYTFKLLGEKEQLQHSVTALEESQSAVEDQVVGLVAEKERHLIRSQEAEKRTQQLEVTLAATEAELSDLKEARAAVDERLAEFNALREKFQRMIDSGTLDITFRRGRMIVELPAQVLFDSGSAELSEAGQAAVLSVAKILRKVPRHRFLVGGHTDNVPAVKEYKSNWALSAARAVGVTEHLVQHGVDQKRLVVAGYSQFDPVALNRSEPGRQKNRRIEIVLEPYLERQVAESLLGEEALGKK